MNISNPWQLSDEMIDFLLTGRLGVLYEEGRLASSISAMPYSLFQSKGDYLLFIQLFKVSRHQLFSMTEECVIIN